MKPNIQSQFTIKYSPRLPPAPCDISEYRGAATDPHGLAQPPQEQGSVLCQEGEGSPPRGHV